jgi:Uma2 family endonuclease
MARKPPEGRATYEDVQALPEHVVGELIDGELIVSPRPAPAHASVASGVLTDLHGLFQRGAGGGPGGWWILFEPELHLHADVLVPDVAGWRRERMPALPAGAFFTEAPDWLCEVLSPRTARLDRARKMTVYAREGVAHLWLLDRGPRTLEVYRLVGDRWTLMATHSGADRVRVEPFEAVELDLGAWWPDASESP